MIRLMTRVWAGDMIVGGVMDNRQSSVRALVETYQEIYKDKEVWTECVIKECEK